MDGLKEKETNELRAEFPAREENIALARTLAAAFVCGLDPLLSEVMDLKMAVSEAVTNAVIHGYAGSGTGRIAMECRRVGRQVSVRVQDWGAGIADVARAREPLFTTCPQEERSGMGFTVMEMLCDTVQVESRPGAGTAVILGKTFAEPGDGGHE